MLKRRQRDGGIFAVRLATLAHTITTLGGDDHQHSTDS
jgi:hypothetical protein